MVDPEQEQQHEPTRETWPPPGTGFWLILSAAVSVGLILTALFPFTFASPTGPLLSLRNPGTALVALQVILFVPMGVVEGELARRVLGGLRAGAWGVVLVALDAALLALICETLQYWVSSRTSSLVDVLAAAFGGVLGYMLSTLWRGHPA
jgi:glycopeptide antibiotics resistance protein